VSDATRAGCEAGVRRHWRSEVAPILEDLHAPDGALHVPTADKHEVEAIGDIRAFESLPRRDSTRWAEAMFVRQQVEREEGAGKTNRGRVP